MKNNNYILTDEIINKFNLNVILNKNAKPNKIKYISIIRVGLELAGIFIYKKLWSIVYLGSKEQQYLQTLTKNEIINKLEKIFESKPPLIILGKTFSFVDEILEVGIKHPNIPIVRINQNYNYLTNTVTNYLTERLAQFDIEHGTLLEVYGIGVFIVGKSGVGKSELAVDLVKKGHIFIADDAAEIARIGNNLIGRPTELTKGFIEIRGLGILDFNKTFGYHRSITSTRIKIIIELVVPDLSDNKQYLNYERLGREKTINFKGIDVNYYKIPILPGRRVSEIIETAIADFKLKKEGFNFEKELLDKIKSKGGK